MNKDYGNMFESPITLKFIIPKSTNGLELPIMLSNRRRGSQPCNPKNGFLKDGKLVNITPFFAAS